MGSKGIPRRPLQLLFNHIGGTVLYANKPVKNAQKDSQAVGASGSTGI